MFTGIIEGVGSVKSLEKKKDHAQIEILCGFDLGKINVGDSISVNGCCLTVTSRLGNSFWADISIETLEASTFKDLKKGAPVNIERALMVGERLGGHIVQGHVDTVGEIVDIVEHSGFKEFKIKISRNFSRYIVDKGSVAVDGVSLTVNACEKDCFKVMVIPHTGLKSTFEGIKKGDKVNLEVDIIGKFVEKLTFMDSEQYKAEKKITEEFLKKHGF